MKKRKLVALTIALATSGSAYGNCIQDQDGRVVCGGGQCERDRYGNVYCAQPGGGAVKDRYGVVQCGAGYCVRNREGEVWCSRRQGGGAALNSYGEAKCLGGCEPGTAERCEPGR